MAAARSDDERQRKRATQAQCAFPPPILSISEGCLQALAAGAGNKIYFKAFPEAEKDREMNREEF